MGKTEIKLSARLAAVGSFVRDGSRFADVGTDHALLPCALVMSGRVSGALATDIAPGPIASAQANIDKYCPGRVETCVCDGISGIWPFEPDDIAVAGMGGELIADILAKGRRELVQSAHLILQPMSRAGELRRFLCGNGFAITDEKCAREGKRIYAVISARYTGVTQSLSCLEELCGRANLERNDEDAVALVRMTAANLEKVIKARNGSDDGAEYESAALKEAESYLCGRRII